jgi:hypothetical protein
MVNKHETGGGRAGEGGRRGERREEEGKTERVKILEARNKNKIDLPYFQNARSRSKEQERIKKTRKKKIL